MEVSSHLRRDPLLLASIIRFRPVVLPLFRYFFVFFLFSMFPSSYFTMQTLAQARSSGGRRAAGGDDGSPARYPPPYDVSAYI